MSVVYKEHEENGTEIGECDKKSHEKYNHN